ncbi:MAG: sulfotransferase [Myxococcota bacterium]|nr:sulfotransferase [Myxococcota bacterium]MDW8360859.1 sulfotransferase [Myxococcales bacterium]
MQERLVFLISPPRSGSTLLQRMLGSHADVLSPPEPHLLTPLAYLGFHDRVDRAPYDAINSAEALRLYVRRLPRGEEDYLDALRAYADTMYGRLLESSGRKLLLDKTPAYATVLPFVTRLYPRARYVVLTRHPLAVFASYANSFFEGRWEEAHRYNPIVERYVPPIARLIRERAVPLLHVRYERLVAEPEAELRGLFEFLRLPHDPRAVDYGERFSGPSDGPGDPIGVGRHRRPTTASVHRWATEVATDPAKRTLARRMIDALSDDDLEAWGEPRRTLWEPLERAGAPRPASRVVNGYTLQRRVLLALRKDVHRRPHGALLERIRYYCDVILRDTL